jgi:hypothetical protein
MLPEMAFSAARMTLGSVRRDTLARSFRLAIDRSAGGTFWGG